MCLKKYWGMEKVVFMNSGEKKTVVTKQINQLKNTMLDVLFKNTQIMIQWLSNDNQTNKNKIITQ